MTPLRRPPRTRKKKTARAADRTVEGLIADADADRGGRAKVNLTLRVVGRRVDGYHDLESVVAFADCADRLSLTPGSELNLKTTGPLAQACGETADNLVFKAAQLLGERVPDLKLGDFTLDKVLPVAAGIGGGSADAAAALRLLAQANGLALDDAAPDRGRAADRRRRAGLPRLARLRHDRRRRNAAAAEPAENALRDGQSPRSRRDQGRVRGAGPAQRRIAGRRHRRDPRRPPGRKQAHRSKTGSKRLPPAPTTSKRRRCAFSPSSARCSSALNATNGAWLARMSGSGATCFAIYREHRRGAARGAENPARSPALVGACGSAELERSSSGARAKLDDAAMRCETVARVAVDRSVAQCDRARQNATTCSSAVFIGEAGNSASASTAIAP